MKYNAVHPTSMGHSWGWGLVGPGRWQALEACLTGYGQSQELDVGSFPPLNPWAHLIEMLNRRHFWSMLQNKKIWFPMFIFSSFKCSPDASVNAWQGGAFGKQSYCRPPVPERGLQWKQTCCSKSVFTFLLFQGSCRCAGHWVCTSKPRSKQLAASGWLASSWRLCSKPPESGRAPSP